MSLTPEQIEAGWVEHDGGPCPVEPDTAFLCLLFRNGETSDTRIFAADEWNWQHTNRPYDIIAYRPEPKP